MKHAWILRGLSALGLMVAAWGQSPSAGLRGLITDPSGASVPAALVQLRGPGGEQRATTNEAGRYEFASLRPGKYMVRVIAKGFTISQRRDLQVTGAATLDVQLTIEAQSQVVNVEDEANKLSLEPEENASALVLGEKELAALSDDPDELEQQLQAMAGPSAGPNGGQIYIDGFSGGRMPPKSSIREVRINSNPYSTEFDRPGFGRIEILTRPGTDKIRGQVFAQYNDEALNSRSPLLTQATRPPYSQRFVGFNLTGPIKKQKASFGFDFERRAVDENAFILATTLDNLFQPVSVNKAILTPQTRTSFGPRLDLAINSSNTMVVRYQNGRSSSSNDGVGNFALESRAYDRKDSDDTFQVTETAALSARAVNESRFQFMRSVLTNTGDNSVPSLSVQGAFESGGSQIGNSGNTQRSWELANTTTFSRRTHTLKWGARLRNSSLDDTSVSNFGGSYTFFGGLGPLLDANNQPVAGTSVQISALERYRRTLLFQQAGYTADEIRALGGGASQFSISAGTPVTSVSQFDAGVFVNDDWRIRSNLTLSYGLRYETQTNISDFGNWAPRAGIAWGIGGGQGKQVKTVLRAGFGAFYDRVTSSITLQALRFNGQTQQSYLILNPNFFPVIPSLISLESGRQPQQLQIADSRLQAPRSYQSSIGLERQINQYTRLSVQYVASRGVHLQRSRNINAPIGRIVPVWRFPVPHSDRDHRFQPDAAVDRQSEREVQEHLPVRLLLARIRPDRRRGITGGSLQLARRVGTLVVWRRAAPGRGWNQSAASFQAEHQPVRNDQQRGALQHHYRAGHQWRRIHERTTLAGTRPGRGSVQRRRPGVRSGTRVFQPEPSGGNGHHAELRTRPGKRDHEYASVADVVFRQPW